MLCQFLLCSKVMQSYTYIHSLSHILFHHVLSQETGYSSLCYTVGPHCLSIFLKDVHFFRQSWFTVFCQFSTVRKSNPVTHAYVHTFFFSHHPAPSPVTRYSSQCCTAGSHCLSIPKATVCTHQSPIASPSHSLPLSLGNHKSVL